MHAHSALFNTAWIKKTSWLRRFSQLHKHHCDLDFTIILHHVFSLGTQRDCRLPLCYMIIAPSRQPPPKFDTRRFSIKSRCRFFAPAKVEICNVEEEQAHRELEISSKSRGMVSSTSVIALDCLYFTLHRGNYFYLLKAISKFVHQHDRCLENFCPLTLVTSSRFLRSRPCAGNTR